MKALSKTLVAVVLSLVASTAFGESLLETGDRATDRVAEHVKRLADLKRLTDPARERLGQLLAKAEEMTLPVEYLESKIREGVCKRIDPDRIVRIIEDKLEHLERLSGKLDARLEAAGHASVDLEVRRDVLLSMQQATDLRLSVAAVTEVVANAVELEKKFDADLVIEAVHLAGVARGCGIPSDRIERIVEAGVIRGYGSAEFSQSAQAILGWSANYAGELPGPEVGRWMEQAILASPQPQQMMDRVEREMYREFPPPYGPPPDMPRPEFPFEPPTGPGSQPPGPYPQPGDSPPPGDYPPPDGQMPGSSFFSLPGNPADLVPTLPGC